MSLLVRRIFSFTFSAVSLTVVTSSLALGTTRPLPPQYYGRPVQKAIPTPSLQACQNVTTEIELEQCKQALAFQQAQVKTPQVCLRITNQTQAAECQQALAAKHVLVATVTTQTPVQVTTVPTKHSNTINSIQPGQQAVNTIGGNLPMSPNNVPPVTHPLNTPSDVSPYQTSIIPGSTVASNLPPPPTNFRLPFITVSTSPYIGDTTAWDASDILNQAGKINEDLLLLQTRQQMVEDMKRDDLQLTRPIIEISGGVEGQMEETDGYDHSQGSIDLSTAELDFHAFASDWASGFMAFNFDDSPDVTGSRVPNSRVFLSRGFVNIGNLDESPFYGSIGQMYLPFGRYASDMLTTPITQSLFRILDRTALIGLYHGGFNLSAYAYQGNMTTNGDSVFKQGGANAVYKHAFQKDTLLSVGTGVTSNIADSQGLQNTGLSSDTQFSGFDTSTGSNALQHRIPGGDVHGEFNFGPWAFRSEYLSAIERASTADLTFNDQGALPSAMHVELERQFPLRNLTMHALVAYDHSWQALAANLPYQSIMANIRTSFWKNTVEGFEYRHDIDYSSTDQGTGSQEDIPTNQPIFGSGKSRNIYLIQVGVYF